MQAMSRHRDKGTLNQRQLAKSSPRSEFWAGGRDIVPLMVGALPFGIIFGTLAHSSGLSFAGTVAMSAAVYAGSSQFIALGLLAAGTGWTLIVLTTFVVNLRHLLYSVSLVPYVKRLPQTWKIPLAFWLTDEAFAVTINRYNAADGSPYKHWYYLGSASLFYLNWQFCTFLGLTVGQLIPNAASWGLDFAMSATFIGMVIPYLKSKPMVTTVIVSGIVAMLTYTMPNKSGLIVAALVGVAAGVGCEVIGARTKKDA